MLPALLLPPPGPTGPLLPAHRPMRPASLAQATILLILGRIGHLLALLPPLSQAPARSMILLRRGQTGLLPALLRQSSPAPARSMILLALGRTGLLPPARPLLRLPALVQAMTHLTPGKNGRPLPLALLPPPSPLARPVAMAELVAAAATLGV